MEPEIQYAITSDDVSIAFCTVGDGPPLLVLPPMPTHLQLEWRSHFAGVGYLALAKRYRVIRCDARGGGLSQRSGADFSFDPRMLDVDAVLDKLGLAQVALHAIGPSGMFAINYAARRAERVSALILSECFPSFGSIATVPQAQALMALQRNDYETFTETMGSIFFGWAASDLAREFAALVREAVTPEQMQVFTEAFMSVDVTDLLPQVKARTLVLHHRRATLVPMEVVTNLAARIPAAKLVVLEGDTVAGTPNDPRGTWR